MINKTTFDVIKMDCPSEEQMIRMKLEDISQIKRMDFDIPNRKLFVFHFEDYTEILHKLQELKLGTSWVETVEVTSIIPEESNNQKERLLLWQVLIINFAFFLIEIISGFFSHSMGLMADSLDMLADSLVYGLALFAVGKAIVFKKKIAKISGYFQLFLALLGLFEVIRRFIQSEQYPDFYTMVFVSFLALIGNAICLYLLQKNKSKDAHIQASKIFTSNDIVINIGVILAGVLVYLSQSYLPDLIIGFVVFFIVGRGAFKILNLSK